MYEPTVISWTLIVLGITANGPLLYVQSVMIMRPNSERAKSLMIGKFEDWRDKSHFKSAYAFARVDWLIFVPLLSAGIIGIVLAKSWGYVLFGAAGAIALYINVFLWFFEKEYVYPVQGPLVYYTYWWGNFVYWGAAATIYTVIRLNGIDI